MAIEFYREFGELGYLANYSNYGFYKNGIYYKTVEHYYQSEKFDNVEIKNRIINAETPREAASIGRDRNNKRKENFKDIKNDVMLEGLLEKFRQNKDILYKLIETRDEEIVENTVDEYYWGIGKDKSGKNVIGSLLMKTRDILKKEIIDTIINNCCDEVYVLGHNNPDCDSIMSSYILSNILNSKGIKSHFAILDNNYDYSNNDKQLIIDYLPSKPEIISNTNDKRILLVDHNTLDGIDTNNVVGSIDHHIITNQVKDILEMEYASTGLLIYDTFKNEYKFSDEEKFLIGLTVLADTEYLCSSRYSNSDKKLYEELGLDIDVKGMQQKYFVTTDFNNSIEDNINSNIKYYDFDNNKISRVLISSYTNDKNNYYDKYVDYIKKLDGNYLLIWADYESKKTYIYYNGIEKELGYLTTSTFVVLKNLDKNKIYIKR